MDGFVARGVALLAGHGTVVFLCVQHVMRGNYLLPLDERFVFASIIFLALVGLWVAYDALRTSSELLASISAILFGLLAANFLFFLLADVVGLRPWPDRPAQVEARPA